MHRVVPLTFGWVDVPKSVSVHGADPTIALREPVIGVLLDTDDGWVLLDTGCDDSGTVDALDGAGVAPEDVAVVALSHLHYDHVGGLHHLDRRVPVHCQRRELEYGLHDPTAAANEIHRHEFDDPAIDWRLADGEVEIVDGVRAIPTYGHTPGHQSFDVTLAGGGGFLFAFDAADLQENIDDELPVGGAIGCAPETTLEPIRRLKALAAATGHRLVPGHDPDVWPALVRELRP